MRGWNCTLPRDKEKEQTVEWRERDTKQTGFTVQLLVFFSPLPAGTAGGVQCAARRRRSGVVVREKRISLKKNSRGWN